MTPQFEIIAEQERMENQKPQDSVMGAHVMDNMQSLMFGTEPQLSQPGNIMDKPSIMPVEKFGLDKLNSNESPIPANHDCDRCVIDAAACTLLQAASENSSIMDRINIVSQLRQTVPGFDSMPSDAVNAMIKEGMDVIKAKRAEMQTNTTLLSPVEATVEKPEKLVEAIISPPKIEEKPQQEPEKQKVILEPKIFTSTKADHKSETITPPQEIITIKPLPMKEDIQQPETPSIVETLSEDSQSLKQESAPPDTQEIKLEAPHVEQNPVVQKLEPEKVQVLSQSSELKSKFSVTVQTEPVKPIIEPKVIVNRTTETSIPEIHSIPVISVPEIRKDLSDTKPESPAITVEPQYLKPENSIPEPKHSAVKVIQGSQQLVTEVSTQEMGQEIFLNTQEQIIEQVVESPQIEPDEEFVDLPSSVPETHNVFTYIPEQQNTLADVPEETIVELLEPSHENHSFPIDTEEPAPIDYVFETSEVFPVSDELPVIQTDILLPSVTEEIVETVFTPEPPTLSETVKIQLQPLTDLQEGIVEPIVIDPVLQAIYQYETPEDIAVDMPAEPELILEIKTIEPPVETPENVKNTETVQIPEHHKPQVVEDTLQNLKDVIKEFPDTDTEDRKLEWNQFVEKDPVLRDVAEMISSILLQLILLNNPEMNHEVYTAKTIANGSLLYRYLEQKTAVEETQLNDNKINPIPPSFPTLMLFFWSYSNALTQMPDQDLAV